ncbi:hypothetical protein NX722_14550 [Endozoicomonas gorgoniicola]|uniref:Tetratricopeptide repeat protein n=1 Tax=Endozoicomonas gorgoniicola TaxID=1234144 RepID=A0ABT3MWT8_9GAMM|nr:hypothetical protein [Endozoicomonas gorgoniicola]MCW7553825.1 hypothetical protein [Endozoicomonas gorgoniicola]
MDNGYRLFKLGKWNEAIEEFKAIKGADDKQEIQKIAGHTRALNKLGQFKASLNVHDQLPDSGDKTIIVSRATAFQGLKRYEEAEAQLLTLFELEKGIYETDDTRPCNSHDTNLTLVRPCNNHDTNLALVRLWELMGKYDNAEALLRLTFSQESGDYRKGKPCDNHFTNLALARFLQFMRRYKEALALLLATFSQESGDYRKGKPCDNHDTNMALVRLWELMGKYDEAEALLLATFSQESGDYDKGIPCKKHDTNLALARLWGLLGKYDEAEALLLATFSQESGDYRKGKPCKKHQTNLALARFLQTVRRYDEAEALLLATFSQESGDYKKGKPCNNHDTNLALVRFLELMGRYDEAEALLLATFSQESGDLKKGKPCNNHDTNLALAYIWERKGKLVRARNLITKALDTKFLTKDQKDSYKLKLAISYIGTEEFNAHIDNVTSPVDKEHIQSIHNLKLFIGQGLDESQKKDNSLYLDKALTHVKKALSYEISNNEQKAKLLSQKAHVMRFLKPGEREQWRGLFKEAARLDPSRDLKDKMEPWRKDEDELLKKMKIRE